MVMTANDLVESPAMSDGILNPTFLPPHGAMFFLLVSICASDMMATVIY